MINEKYLSIFDEIKKHGGKVDNRDPNDKILIVDGLNAYLRVFSAIPTVNSDGKHIGAIVGFLKSIGYAVKMLRPTRCIIVFDGKGGSTRRRKLYPNYKAKRNPKTRFNRLDKNLSDLTDENKSMRLQLIRIVKYLETLPVTLFSIDNIEADDVIAYITKQLYVESKVCIMSTDKDFLQLANGRVTIWSPTKKVLYTPDRVLRDYGIPAHNILLSRIIEGDQSDNIKGVFGVGIKTIQKKLTLLLEKDIITIERLFESIEKLDDKSKSTKKLKESKKLLELNYKLMQLHEVDISASAKLKIQKLCSDSIPLLHKANFQILFMHDKLWVSLPNLDSWMTTTFLTLNKYARKTND